MYIKALSLTKRNLSLINDLANVWQKSVKATHLFLSTKDIEELRPEVIAGLKQIPILLVAFSDDDEPIGFAGIAEQKLEMLFISPDYFNHGLGYKLISIAINDYQIIYVDVNEQNPHALKFYQRQGFVIFNRSDLDSANRPFPILYLKKC